jgi:hypothetical protein
VVKANTLVLTALFGVVAVCAAFAQEPNKGAPEIILKAGNMEDVRFAHRVHQDTLMDCSICHDMFPQQTGVIEKLKRKGTLAKKQVMNHCRECHKRNIAAGKPAGPTACNKCHGQ